MGCANAAGAQLTQVLDTILNAPDTHGDVLKAPSHMTTGHSSLPFPSVLGRYRAELPQLPASLAQYNSRAAQLLWVSYQQIQATLSGAVAHWGADRVAIILGSSTGGLDASEDAYAEYISTGELTAGYSYYDQHAFDALCRLLADASGATGPAYLVSTACSSTGKALGVAQRLLDAGAVDAVLSGGSDALCQLTTRGFHSLRILSPTSCRPFDGDRNGINIGEGSALLLLERDPTRGGSRSSPAEGYLRAVGESCDAHHPTAPHPEGAGASLSMTAALTLASMSPAEISYVNAHGTATPHNDAAESLAMLRVFGAEA